MMLLIYQGSSSCFERELLILETKSSSLTTAFGVIYHNNSKAHPK
jgi:hypothetical protein